MTAVRSRTPTTSRWSTCRAARSSSSSDRRRLEPIRAIDITIQILKAARFAHRRGVIHRDLKPHNVIVDDADQAKVTDFGIARAGASDMTETGSIMGTAQYLSPEQAQGHAVSAGSDLYSVAVVLYEMLTARVPFDGESAVTIALKHVSEAPTPPSVINPAVPPELEQVVMWALNKNPVDRPTDADQFINALEAAKSVIQSGGGQRTASMAALAAVGGVGAAYGSPAAGGPGVSPEAAAAAYRRPAGYDTGSYYVDGEHREPPPDEPRMWPWVTLLVILLLAGGGVAAYLLTRPQKKVVPTVTNQTLNTARTILQNDGFLVSVLNVTNDKRAGIVIGQDPQGNDKAKEGSTVTLTVSQGPGSTTVPSVVGKSQEAAQKALTKAHLKYNVQHEPSETVAKGKATRTDPANGQAVGVGSTVTLYISSGKPMVAVPNVIGEDVASARSQLNNAGFVVATTNQTTTSAPDGNVVDQSPAGNTKVAAGSTVNLVVAKAPTTAQVPDVTGDTAQGAINQLKAAGFKVAQQTKAVTKQSKDGIVVAEQPKGGSTQNKGSTVTITVGVFTPPPTTTPTTPTSPTTTPTTSNTP